MQKKNSIIAYNLVKDKDYPVYNTGRNNNLKKILEDFEEKI